MPAELSSELVTVGRFGTPHGVAGWIRVASFTHPRENIEIYRPWLVGDGAARRALEIEALRAHGQGFVARIAGISDRDQAQALTGLDILVPRTVFPDLSGADEYYWRDLIGLEVRNDDGSSLGRVISLLETAAHDVLVLEGADGERLIPFVAAFVVAVDQQAGVIHARWQDPA